jgi:hypothetical protein
MCMDGQAPACFLPCSCKRLNIQLRSQLGFILDSASSLNSSNPERAYASKSSVTMRGFHISGRSQTDPGRYLVNQAHFPSKAMMPAPRKTQINMNTSRLLSFVRKGLKMKSLANSSTSPVYIKMPADMESRTPLTTFAVEEFGLYVVRTPRPIAMARGVVICKVD